MRIVLREALEGTETGKIGEVLVIQVRESHLPEDGIVITEEVYEEDEHWANTFKCRGYSVAELKALIVQDTARRRQEHQRRQAAACQGTLAL